jgi:hypothetical protein
MGSRFLVVAGRELTAIIEIKVYRGFVDMECTAILSVLNGLCFFVCSFCSHAPNQVLLRRITPSSAISITVINEND